jgi:hypothetical protein
MGRNNKGYKMEIKYGEGKTEYGPGVDINLTGNEVATAIAAYLMAHDIIVSGARTIRVNGELCKEGRVYVDPSGYVITEDGEKMSGRGEEYKDIKNITEGRWFEMDKSARIALLSSEFAISEEDALNIYDDDPNELPDYVRDYFNR